VLLWVSLAVAMASTVPAIRPDYWDGLSSVVVIGISLLLALYAWLVFMIYMGRNWARWLVVVFLAFGWLSDLADPKWATQSVVANFADFVNAALDLSACLLLLRGEGAAWFKKARVPVQA
jgi:hypothetical protein